MSDAKTLPDNLDEIKTTDAYIELDDKYTIKQLERKLRDAKVAFLSADDKPDLIWRWLDHQGADLEVSSNADTQNDSEQVNSATSNDNGPNGGATSDNGAGSGTDDTSDATESVTPAINEPAESVEDNRDYVEVKNTGDFNMLETATSTLIIAGKTTKVYIHGHATKDQVLRNIEQYNHNRGKNLTVIN
jgi:hypothetical protein